MGLDMYLSKRVYVGANYEHRNVKGTIYITHGQDNEEIKVNFKRVSYIIEDIGYWRKANAIHKWFVENVQDGEDNCKEYYVSYDKIRELLDVCKEVKKSIKLVDDTDIPKEQEGYYSKKIEDPTIAQELLPTTKGFFFGDTSYNEWYLRDIEDTIEICKNVLKDGEENNFQDDLYYQSSW